MGMPQLQFNNFLVLFRRHAGQAQMINHAAPDTRRMFNRSEEEGASTLRLLLLSHTLGFAASKT